MRKAAYCVHGYTRDVGPSETRQKYPHTAAARRKLLLSDFSFHHAGRPGPVWKVSLPLESTKRAKSSLLTRGVRISGPSTSPVRGNLLSLIGQNAHPLTAQEHEALNDEARAR